MGWSGGAVVMVASAATEGCSQRKVNSLAPSRIRRCINVDQSNVCGTGDIFKGMPIRL